MDEIHTLTLRVTQALDGFTFEARLERSNGFILGIGNGDTEAKAVANAFRNVADMLIWRAPNRSPA